METTHNKQKYCWICLYHSYNFSSTTREQGIHIQYLYKLHIIAFKTLAFACNLIPSGCPWGEVGGQGGAHVPKAQGLERHDRGPRPTMQYTKCHRGMMERQTNRQTNFPCIIRRFQIVPYTFVTATIHINAVLLVYSFHSEYNTCNSSKHYVSNLRLKRTQNRYDLISQAPHATPEF